MKTLRLKSERCTRYTEQQVTCLSESTLMDPGPLCDGCAVYFHREYSHRDYQQAMTLKLTKFRARLSMIDGRQTRRRKSELCGRYNKTTDCTYSNDIGEPHGPCDACSDYMDRMMYVHRLDLWYIRS